MAMDSKTLTEFTEEHFTVKVWGEGIKFEPKPKPCGRCGDVVQDQRISLIRKVYEYRPQFWEIKCNSCDLKMTVNELAKYKKE